MGLPVIYVLTHDSIGVGEDGPTHQPIEQLANLRSIPNLYVLRPADGRKRQQPGWQRCREQMDHTALVLSRRTYRNCPGPAWQRKRRLYS